MTKKNTENDQRWPTFLLLAIINRALYIKATQTTKSALKSPYL